MSIQIVAPGQTQFSAPRWAVQLATGGKTISRKSDVFDLTVHESRHGALVSYRLPGAIDLDAHRFEHHVAESYDCIRQELRSLRHARPVRFWNHIPAIHQPMDASRDRYMVFNAGRFAAMRKWFGEAEKSPALFPAASGIGHDGGELVIHCLALAENGIMIDNPRQIPAFRYSARYGPRPPCFARGTLVRHPVDHHPMLLAAGTASICGEQSVHVGNLAGQITETLKNLRALLQASMQSDQQVALDAFTDIRIYYLRPDDQPEIELAAREAFGPEAQIDLIRADLCRTDLLVEIEGIAPLQSGARQ